MLATLLIARSLEIFLVVSLGNSVRERKFTLAMVRNSLLNEEIKRNFLINDTHALVMENRVEAKT